MKLLEKFFIYLFFTFLSKKHILYSVENVALSLCCNASLLNPSKVILTGEAIYPEDIEKIEKICLEYIPQEFMPQIQYQKEYTKDYMQGIYLLSLKIFIEELL